MAPQSGRGASVVSDFVTESTSFSNHSTNTFCNKTRAIYIIGLHKLTNTPYTHYTVNTTNKFFVLFCLAFDFIVFFCLNNSTRKRLSVRKRTFYLALKYTETSTNAHILIVFILRSPFIDQTYQICTIKNFKCEKSEFANICTKENSPHFWYFF